MTEEVDSRIRWSRSTGRTVECVECGARPGEQCIGARDKLRVSNHRERYDLLDRLHEAR